MSPLLVFRILYICYMATNLKIKGNFFELSDSDTDNQFFKLPKCETSYIYNIENSTDYFVFDSLNSIRRDSQKIDFTDINEVQKDGVVQSITTIEQLDDFLSENIGGCPTASGGSGVQSVTGPPTDNTDPANPTVRFPDADEVDDTSTANKFVRKLYITLDSAESSITRATGGGRTTFTITHNFNTKDILDRVYRISDDRRINWRIETPTVNTLEASRAGTVADGLFRILLIT